MDIVYQIASTIGAITIIGLAWFFIALGWLILRFGSNPIFLDYVIMFPLSVLEWFGKDK